MGDDQKAQDSQQEPQQDSGLQTPQPDQPIPSEPRQLEEDEMADQEYDAEN